MTRNSTTATDHIITNLDVSMISETQIAEIFPESQFTIEGFSEPSCLDRAVNGGGILI